MSYAIITMTLAAVFVVGFLVGFLPGRTERIELSAQNGRLQQQSAALRPQLSDLQQRVRKLQADLELAELRGTVGLMSQRANGNNFGAAAELSGGFFDGIRESIAKTDNPALKNNLRKILDRRDAVTVGLAQANPAVKEQLAEIYAEFFEARRSG